MFVFKCLSVQVEKMGEIKRIKQNLAKQLKETDIDVVERGAGLPSQVRQNWSSKAI